MVPRALAGASLGDGRAHRSHLRVVAVHAATEGAHRAVVITATFVLATTLIAATLITAAVVVAPAVVSVLALPVVLAAVGIVVALGEAVTVIARRPVISGRGTRPCHDTSRCQ